MKILCITDITMPGGVDTYIQQLTMAAISENINIYLLIGRQSGSDNLYHIGIDLLGSKCIRRDIESNREPKVIIKNLEDILQQVNPDIVHIICGSPRSALAIRKYIADKNIPFFFTESLIDKDWQFPDEIIKSIIPLYNKACKIFTVSQNNADIIKNVYHWPSENLVSIPNGVHIAPVRARVRRGCIRKFVTVARLDRQKGIDVLLDAIRLMPQKYKDQCTFTIWGEGAERLKYEGLIQLYKLSPYVSLLGWNSHISQELCNYDCFILPSRYEGMPIALMEAMAAKLYCIASKVSGIPEVLVGGECGRLFTNENAEELCEYICDSVDKPDICETAAQKGYEHILKNHDCSKNMKQIIKYWNEQI